MNPIRRNTSSTGIKRLWGFFMIKSGNAAHKLAHCSARYKVFVDMTLDKSTETKKERKCMFKKAQ